MVRQVPTVRTVSRNYQRYQPRPRKLALLNRFLHFVLCHIEFRLSSSVRVSQLILRVRHQPPQALGRPERSERFRVPEQSSEAEKRNHGALLLRKARHFGRDLVDPSHGFLLAIRSKIQPKDHRNCEGID